MPTNNNYTWRLLRFLSSICTLLTTTRMSTMIIRCSRQCLITCRAAVVGGWSTRMNKKKKKGGLNE